MIDYIHIKSNYVEIKTWIMTSHENLWVWLFILVLIAGKLHQYTRSPEKHMYYGGRSFAVEWVSLSSNLVSRIYHAPCRSLEAPFQPVDTQITQRSYY